MAQQLNPALNVAFKAARKAGDMMLRASNNLSTIRVDNKAFNDFVSEVDRQSEAIIIETLQEAYPHHRILSEEAGALGNERAEFEWIIDPLDGTTNYLHGHPQYAVSIALLEKGVLITAVTKDSPAEKAGIQQGDIMLSVGNIEAKSPSQMMEALANIKPGTVVRVLVLRGDVELAFNVTIGEFPDN